MAGWMIACTIKLHYKALLAKLFMKPDYSSLVKLYETLIAGCPARAGCPRRARCPRSLWSPQNLDSSWGKARASQHRGYATSTLPLSHGRVAEWAGRARNRRARRLLLQALWRRSQPSLPGSAHPPIMAHGAYRPSPIAHRPLPMAHGPSPIGHACPAICLKLCHNTAQSSQDPQHPKRGISSTEVVRCFERRWPMVNEGERCFERR